MLNLLSFFSTLIYCFICSAQIIIPDVYLDTKIKPSGTPERLEYEFKLALRKTDKLSVNDISKMIEDIFKDLSENKMFEFEKLVDSHYYLDEKFQSFIFKDYYFDTDASDLLNLKSSMRLRYRWTSPQRYFFYRFLPFIKLFYPTRCEFQFKRDYKFHTDNRVSVYESRFEFRNESEPFLSHPPAPSSPWSFNEYSGYFRSGQYKKFKILPTYNAVKLLGNKDNVEFKMKVESTTERYRSHLSIKSPWGVGPNPDQAFILTIDKTSFLNSSFFEIEIEIDRNIFTKVSEISKLRSLKDPIDIEAKEFSLKAKNALEVDLDSIQKGLLKKLDAIGGVKKLIPMYKYQRMMQSLK
jgi:hypothetical protein